MEEESEKTVRRRCAIALEGRRTFRREGGTTGRRKFFCLFPLKVFSAPLGRRDSENPTPGPCTQREELKISRPEEKIFRGPRGNWDLRASRSDLPYLATLPVPPSRHVGTARASILVGNQTRNSFGGWRRGGRWGFVKVPRRRRESSPTPSARTGKEHRNGTRLGIAGIDRGGFISCGFEWPAVGRVGSAAHPSGGRSRI